MCITSEIKNVILYVRDQNKMRYPSVYFKVYLYKLIKIELVVYLQ